MVNSKYISEIIEDITKQQESIILDQLGDMVSRGLLVIESTKPVLVQEAFTNKITLKQAVRLTLRDKEYIEKLETENKELKDKLEKISSLFSRSQ